MWDLRDTVWEMRDAVWEMRDAVWEMRDAVWQMRDAVWEMRDAVKMGPMGQLGHMNGGNDGMTRPEKSLHLSQFNPATNLHFVFNPV